MSEMMKMVRSSSKLQEEIKQTRNSGKYADIDRISSVAASQLCWMNRRKEDSENESNKHQ